jgi:hypothetical protein
MAAPAASQWPALQGIVRTSSRQLSVGGVSREQALRMAFRALKGWLSPRRASSLFVQAASAGENPADQRSNISRWRRGSARIARESHSPRAHDRRARPDPSCTHRGEAAPPARGRGDPDVYVFAASAWPPFSSSDKATRRADHPSDTDRAGGRYVRRLPALCPPPRRDRWRTSAPTGTPPDESASPGS